MRFMNGAVLGSPISHSLSPQLHLKAFDLLDIEGSYESIEVKGGELCQFLSATEGEYNYLSLTMPLKEEALSCAVEPSNLVKRIHSANTLSFRNGKIYADSTDGIGFIKALEYHHIEDLDRVALLGGGGTARSIVAALDGRAKSISIYLRSQSRRESLMACAKDSQLIFSSWKDGCEFSKYSLVVNTTPISAADSLVDSVEIGSATLFDVLYRPWPTQLGQRWIQSGGKVVNGLDMLIYQGIEQISLLHDIPNQEEVARELRNYLTTIM